MVCLAPRAPGDSVRPRRLSSVVVRPLNFTVRAHGRRRLSLLGVITGSVGAADDGSDRWVEYSHVYATVANTDDVRIMVPILVHADEALEPLGFHRDSTRGEYRGMLVRGGVLASYKAGGLAAATIVAGSRPGCIVFSATNYDEHVAGLVQGGCFGCTPLRTGLCCS